MSITWSWNKEYVLVTETKCNRTGSGSETKKKGPVTRIKMFIKKKKLEPELVFQYNLNL